MGLGAKIGAGVVIGLSVACLGMAIWNVVEGIQYEIAGNSTAATTDAMLAVTCMLGTLSGTYATTRIIEEDL